MMNLSGSKTILLFFFPTPLKLYGDVENSASGRKKYYVAM